MAKYQSLFLHTLEERGFIHQVTHPELLDKLLLAETVPAYIGFDCTANSLHVGSLVQIMILRWLQKCLHKPIVLMGGATTKIGDPSGKDEARPALSDAQIAENMAGIKTVFTQFLKFGDGTTDARMVNNADWLANLNYIDFLRDYGRYFSVNRMLSMDSVKLRLEREQPLSFLEFNYMIMQAYDFVELKNRHGVRLQIGGSDQWGNIVSGINLQHALAHSGGKKIDNYDKELALFGLTTPLLTTASGAKMGKTAAGAVWLNADRLSPYDYYQFWRNTEDADVGRFLGLFTELPMDEVARLAALEGAEINEAKKILAFEATRLCHSETAANASAETARKVFEEGAIGSALKKTRISTSDMESSTIRTLLVRTGLAASGGEARRLIQGGGIYLNDEKITDESIKLSSQDFNAEGVAKISKGKKHHVLIEIHD